MMMIKEFLVYEKSQIQDLVEVDPFVFPHTNEPEQWENHFVDVLFDSQPWNLY